jgi:hypothetical protein
MKFLILFANRIRFVVSSVLKLSESANVSSFSVWFIDYTNVPQSVGLEPLVALCGRLSGM